MCKDCMDKWVTTSGGRECLCPFCREPVLSTESIIIEPFDPNALYESGSDTDEGDLELVTPSAGPPLQPRRPLPVQRADNYDVPALPARNQSMRRVPGPTQAVPSDSQVDAQALHRLMALGFPEEQVKKALTVTHNNVEMAANVL